MVLIWLIKVVFYKKNYYKFIVIYKNEWEYWFNLLSKKSRRETRRLTYYQKNQDVIEQRITIKIIKSD